MAGDAKASSGANASIPGLMEDHGQEHAKNHRSAVFLQSAAPPSTTGVVFCGAGLAKNAPKIGRTPDSQDLSQTKTAAHNTSRVEIVIPASDDGSEAPIGQAIISEKLAGKAKRQTRSADAPATNGLRRQRRSIRSTTVLPSTGDIAGATSSTGKPGLGSAKRKKPHRDSGDDVLPNAGSKTQFIGSDKGEVTTVSGKPSAKPATP